ncbi:MAG: hypothetical protein ACQETH_15625 [Candidatus Rifleibacteriota bacterium]
MNKKEHKNYLDAFKAYSKEVSSNEKKAREFLVRTGIHNRDGNLSKQYLNK